MHAHNESGVCSRRHPRLANFAKLKAYISLKPNPPSFFGNIIFSRLSQWILCLPSYWFHQYYRCFINQTSKFIWMPHCSRKTMVASKRPEDLYWFRSQPYVQSQRWSSAYSSLECSEVLIMGGARMVEEVGELELGDGLPKGRLYVGEWVKW